MSAVTTESKGETGPRMLGRPLPTEPARAARGLSSQPLLASECFLCWSRARAAVESRTQTRRTDSFRSSARARRKMTRVEAPCASHTQGFHGVRRHAVGVQGQEIWAPGAPRCSPHNPLCLLGHSYADIHQERVTSVGAYRFLSSGWQLGGLTPRVLETPPFSNCAMM